MLKRTCFLAIAFCSAVLPLSGQGVEGAINGTIVDQTGSVVVDAAIKVVNPATGLTRTATTSENGTFTVPLLPPGIYTVVVSKAGFANDERKDVQVVVAQSRTLDFSLRPGTVQQTVEVTATPPALETTDGTVGTVIEHQEIVDMPLNGGNFTQLVLLTPGAAPVEAGQQTAYIVQEGAGAISPSVAGQRGQENNYTLDGALNNSIFINTWAIAPPAEAIAEFNVRSHVDDALATVSSGANINVVMRSGNNSLHGSLYEFFRNDVLDARNFFDKSKLPYRQNQFGGTIGGPVLLPYFDGRKKDTWFFVYYEGFRSRQSNSYQESVPTAQTRAGDFTPYLTKTSLGTDSSGNSVINGAIYDPATSTPNTAKPGQVLKTPFPGNMIPVSRFDPTAVAITQKYYPLPNLAVSPTTFPNLYYASSTQVNTDKIGVKFDHRFSNNDTLFGRYNSTDPQQIIPQALPTFNRSVNNNGRSVALGYTHLLGPSTVLTAHYSYVYTNVLALYTPAGDDFITSTHLDNFRPAYDGYALMPTMTVTNGMQGITQQVVPLTDWNHAWNGDLTMVKGAHSISAGVLYYHIHNFDDNATATVTFTRNATSLDGYTNNTGIGMASFLLGIPDTLSGWRGTDWADFTINWIGGYIQDKWQITNRLSLSLGLRYDFVAPANWKDNKVSAVDVNTGKFLIGVAVPPAIPQPTGSTAFFQPQYNGLQPRFGLAYRLAQKTVLRTGFALFQDHNNPIIQEAQAIRIAWPWGYYVNLTGIDTEMPPSYRLSNLPLESSFNNPTQPAPSYAADPNGKTPSSMEYNFGVQQQITPTLWAEVNYVGSLSRHLELCMNWNVAQPGPGAIGPRTPYPQYPTQMNIVSNVGNASYNGLLAKLQKRLSQGLYFLASYTYSKSLDVCSEGGACNNVQDTYDIHSSYGPSDFDLRQMFVLSGTYRVPVGKGRQHLARSGRLIDAIAGGWSVSAIQSVITGLPFSVIAGSDVANTGENAAFERAELVSNPFNGFTQSRLEWFNRTAFKVPATYTFGNSGKNIMRGPRTVNLDFGAHKEFSVTERATLQFRAEFFNSLNHTNFGQPAYNASGGANLGLITTAKSPRIVQFALKVTF